MVAFPNCKINIGLNITDKRNDGYHDLETVFYPIPLKDAVEIIESENIQPDVQFSLSGIPVKGDVEKNLCVKAYHLLKKDFPDIHPVQIHLHKAVPMGAGLGGGSADGAFTLKLLNKKFALNLSEQELIDYSLQLGSDCPFFIINKPSFARGRGEMLEEINRDLSDYKVMLIHPGIHVNTAWAFENISPDKPTRSVKEIIKQPIETWKNELVNDFEKSVFIEYPEIKKIKDKLYNAGAVYASMSGSGSAVYGIFANQQQIEVSFPHNYLVKILHC